MWKAIFVCVCVSLEVFSLSVIDPPVYTHIHTTASTRTHHQASTQLQALTHTQINQASLPIPQTHTMSLSVQSQHDLYI